MTRLAAARAARQAQGAESRERILDAAERLIETGGYPAATISSISNVCGLPASSIYWHFSSKEVLLSAVVQRRALRWASTSAPWSPYAGDLAAFLQDVAQATLAHPDFLRLLMMLTLGGRGGGTRARREMRRVWSHFKADLERIMSDHFRLGTSENDRELAARLARFALAFIDGAYVDSQIDPEGTPMRDLFSDLVIGLEALMIAHQQTSCSPRPS